MRESEMHGHWTRLAPVLVANLISGCTLDSQESLGHDLPDGAARVDADSSVPIDVDVEAGDVPDVDGRALIPASVSDASQPIATTACTPGTYIGMFQASLQALPSEKGGAWIGPPGTQLAPDAGTWSGKLIMTLMAATGAPDAGEAEAAPMVAGSQFLGFDTAGDVLSAPLGSLDCSDQTLSAELVDGTIRSLTATSADAGLAAPLTGTLSATNVSASGSLGSVTGQIHLVVAPYFETVGGTWSATRY